LRRQILFAVIKVAPEKLAGDKRLTILS